MLPKEKARIETDRKLELAGWKVVDRNDYSPSVFAVAVRLVPETSSFFNNNRIINYTLEKSITDGINVNFRVYRIKTKVSEKGGIIKKGDNYDEIARYTNANVMSAAEVEVSYGNKELDRSVINPPQICLVFVGIAKKISPNQSPDFMQKITYSASDGTGLIHRFRNDKSFRVAVTVNILENRLSRINAKSADKHCNEFTNLTDITMYDLAISIFNTLDAENRMLAS